MDQAAESFVARGEPAICACRAMGRAGARSIAQPCSPSEVGVVRMSLRLSTSVAPGPVTAVEFAPVDY